MSILGRESERTPTRTVEVLFVEVAGGGLDPPTSRLTDSKQTCFDYDVNSLRNLVALGNYLPHRGLSHSVTW